MKIPSTSERHRILVIGDLMLDQYWWGSVNRISPEAPVPVICLGEISLAVGGAGNVAANIAGLGATPVLIGCIGDDPEGEITKGLLKTANVPFDTLITVSGRPTTVKTRIVAHGQHVVRVDNEVTERFSLAIETKVLELVKKYIESVKALVISDYAKGLLSNNVLESVIETATRFGVQTIVDPKGKDYQKYEGATLLTPNMREAAEACNLYPDSAGAIGKSGNLLLNQLVGTSILVTEGENGMTLFQMGLEPFHTRAAARETFDVTGAGDTVVAALAVAIASGSTLRNAVEFANAAAGIAVEKVGTTVVTKQMIFDHYPQAIERTSNL